MALEPNKWQKKPVDPEHVMRERLKEVFGNAKLSWAALARKYDCDRSGLQRSIESKLSTVNDFLNDYGYEIVIRRKEKK